MKKAVIRKKKKNFLIIFLMYAVLFDRDLDMSRENQFLGFAMQRIEPPAGKWNNFRKNASLRKTRASI